MSGTHVVPRGEKGAILTDAVTPGLLSVDVVQGYVNRGLVFASSLADAALANGADLEMLIRTAAQQSAHMGAAIQVGGDSQVFLFEGPTTTDPGTGLARINSNRVTPVGTSATLTFSGPTVTVDGLELGTEFLAGGRGGNASGAEGVSAGKTILNPGTDYLIRLTNQSGGNIYASINFGWYEPTA